MFQRVSSKDHLLIIQCNSGHQHTDLIASARYYVLDAQAQSSHLKITHIIFIIGLPRKRGGTKFVSFQGGKWECYHMDSLIPPKDSLITIKSALSMPINDILLDCYTHNTELFHKRLQNWISLSLLHFSNVEIQQNVLDRFNMLSQMFKISQNAHEDHINENLKEISQQQACK